MRLWLRFLVLAVVFAAVGLGTGLAVVRHARNVGDAEAEVRLAGAMAGLFVGGAAVMATGVGMLLLRPKPRPHDPE